METATKTMITVEATVKAPVEKVWQFWGIHDTVEPHELIELPEGKKE